MTANDWIKTAGGNKEDLANDAVRQWASLPEHMRLTVRQSLNKRLTQRGSPEAYRAAIRLAPQINELIEAILADILREKASEQHVFLDEIDRYWPLSLIEHFVDLLIRDIAPTAPREAAVRSLRLLALFGERALRSLPAVQVCSDTADSEKLGLALETAGRMGPDALPFLEQALSDRRVDVVTSALRALAHQDPVQEAVRETLTRLSRHSNPAVAREAAQRLEGRLRPAQKIADLQEERSPVPECCGESSTQVDLLWDVQELTEKWPDAFSFLRSAFETAAEDEEASETWSALLDETKVASGKASDKELLEALDGVGVYVYRCERCKKILAAVG